MAIFLCGCDDSKEEKDTKNTKKRDLYEQNAWQLLHPEIIGTNEIGQIIKLYKLKRAVSDDTIESHYIYSCGNSYSDNHTRGYYKTARVEILFDGQPISLEDAQKLFNTIVEEK